MKNPSETLSNPALSRSELWNALHSLVIFGAMALLLGSVGWTLDGMAGVLLLLGLGLVLFVLHPTIPGSLILKLQGALPVPPYTAPHLFQMVHVLSGRAGLSVPPRIFRIPSPAMTAFAVGTQEDPAIGVTDGLLKNLDSRELAGVLAHEVSHVQRNDTRVLGLAALMARATNLMSFLGQILLFLNFPLLLMGRVTVPWSAILLLVSAPTVSGLLQLALARTREYDADLGAVRLTGDPVGLASALRKLQSQERGFLGRVLAPGTEMTVPPFLRTHPRTEERIQRLLELDPEQPSAEALAVQLGQPGIPVDPINRWAHPQGREMRPWI